MCVGIEPMGLFWSMKQAEGQIPGLRIMKKDVTQPFRVELYVIPEHITVVDRKSAGKDAVAKQIIERRYMGPGVRMFNLRDYVKGTKLRGSLFIPPGNRNRLIYVACTHEYIGGFLGDHCIILIFVGKGPFPAVIDLFGTAGGLNDYRAALLASRGFLSVALAYFGYDDLPENIDLNLEYFVVGYSDT